MGTHFTRLFSAALAVGASIYTSVIIPSQAAELKVASEVALSDPAQFESTYAQVMSQNVPINTAGWSDSAYMTPDGLTIYFAYTPYQFAFFSSDFHNPPITGPERVGHHKGYYSYAPNTRTMWLDNDIYMAMRTSVTSKFGTPVNMSFNTHQADACGMMSADDLEFYYQRDDGGNADIYVVKRTAPLAAWSAPEKLSSAINSASHETNPHISKDKLKLYFTSDRSGGYGKEDIYVSTRTSLTSPWSNAVNLGQKINTNKLDDQAFITSDGKNLYFTRDGGIMVSKLANDGITWATPTYVTFEGRVQPVMKDKNGNVLSGHVTAVAEPSLTQDGKRMILQLVDMTGKTISIAETTLISGNNWKTPIPID